MADAEAIKCLATVEALTDDYCVNVCAMAVAGATGSCPVQECVCDWMGDWPEDDKEGFAGWDLGSLGIKGNGGPSGIGEVAMDEQS